MEQIEIIKRDGTVIKCFNAEPFCTVTQAVQESSLMSDDTVKITLRSELPYKFGKGDRVVINGYTYKIRTTAERALQTERDYVHNLTFYGVMYDLMKCQYRNTDANGNSTKAIFDLTYSIKDFMQVALYNLNRDNPGEWAFDAEHCPDTEPITVTFSKNNVLQVIQDLCSKDKFNLEFRITSANGVNTIHVGKFGDVVTPPSGASHFEWGKGNGLWQLKERKVDDKAIITRLWAEGGTQNVKSGYRDYSDRIQLPYPQRMNSREHKLKDGTVYPANTVMIGIENDADRYLEDVALSQAMGVEEETQTFDSIYPRRTGEVTALGGSVQEFVDDTMDFDLNERDENGTKYLIAGTSAKITFITGKLAGQEFELSEYTHDSKTFRIKSYTDERGLKLPTEDNDAFRFAVGDKYKITDINMPDSYVANAEEDLWFAALEYLNEAKQVRVQYDLTFDRMYFIENMAADSETVLFKVGDYVPVKDTRFMLEKNIRIQKVSRNLLVDHDYTLTLSDTTAISIQTQAVLDIIEHEKIIEFNDLRNLTKAKRGWRTTEELRNMVYDTDGYFDPENIRPNSIDTNMLTVGSKSQQFVLTGVVLQANYGGNPNQFSISSGVLSHLTLNEDSVIAWNMAAQEFTLTQPGGYYVFAKCPKNGSNGTWVVTQEQLKVENASDPNNYYFQVGIIGSLSEGGTFRDFTSTYGFTRINGNTITTGRIVTSDGESYLDLDGNKFKIGTYASSLDFNVTAPNRITLKNVDVVSGAGDPVALGVPRGMWDSSYVYYQNDTVQFLTDGAIVTYRYINPVASKGHEPTDSTYWAIEAKGADGAQGDPGASSYTHIRYAPVLNPTDSQMKTTTDKYIGIAVTNNPTAPTTANSYTWAQFLGDDGTSVSISSRETKYVRSADGVNTPGSSAAWQTSVPAEDPSKPYLWSRTTVTYSDGQSTTAYNVSRVGKDGSSVSISSKEIKYAKGTDGSTIPTDWKAWGEITFQAGDFMWTRTTVTYSDGQSTVAYSVSRIGADGENGLPGAPGADGKTTYLHLKYSNDGGLTFTENNGEMPGSYLGQYTDFEQHDSSNPADYTWGLIEGSAGVGGADAESPVYYEYRYAKNGSRTAAPELDRSNPNPFGWSTTQPSLGALEYLWQTISQKSSLSQKAIFHVPINLGETGIVQDVTGNGNDITLGSSSVASVGGRSALAMPGAALATMANLLPFGDSFTLCFWLRTNLSYFDWCLNGKWGISSVEKRLGMPENTWTHIALRFTEKSLSIFKDGVLVDTASLSERVAGFSMYDSNMFGADLYMDDIWCLRGALADADIQKIKAGTQDALVNLWSLPVRITPADGTNGKSIHSVVNEYAINNSSAAAPTSGWSTAHVAPTFSNKYLWGREVIKDEDGGIISTTTPHIVANYSADGAQGNPGKGISSITEYYLVTSAASGVTRSTSGWSTTPGSTTDTQKYLWNYEKITWTDGSVTYVEPFIIGVHGETGAMGIAPASPYRGDYDPTKHYYGSSIRCDIVKYGGLYYIARTDAGEFWNVPPTNSSKWNTFGAQYESVATDLLLAINANIAGWIFRNNRLESQASDIFLDGLGNQIGFGNGMLIDGTDFVQLRDTSGNILAQIAPDSIANLIYKAGVREVTDSNVSTEIDRSVNSGSSVFGQFQMADLNLGTITARQKLRIDRIDLNAPKFPTSDRDNDYVGLLLTITVTIKRDNVTVATYQDWSVPFWSDSQGGDSGFISINQTFEGAGTYKAVFSAEYEIDARAALGARHITTDIEYTGFATILVPPRNIMGTDGVWCCKDYNHYIKYTHDTGFEVMQGFYGFRINSSGIKKSTDGGKTWGNF